MTGQLALIPGTAEPRVRAGVTLSECGRYRYSLWRAWGTGPRLVFVMLNPSTADASHDDPTIRRCVGFARAWRYGTLQVVNLFAWRATDPRELLAPVDPVGRQNNAAILDACARATLVVAAWGVPPIAPTRAGDVLALIANVAGRQVHCLGRTKDGHPRHPLYLRGDARPEIFREVSRV